MIAIASNIQKVIRQVEGLQAEIPKAVRRALQPERWLPRAREVALATINGLATGEERRLAPEFVGRVSGGLLGAGLGFFLALDARREGRSRSLFGVQESFEEDLFGNVNTTARALSLIGLSPAALEDLLFQWVNTPESEGGKRLDERDAEKTDAEIVGSLMRILFRPDNYDGLEDARAGLLPHIVAFHQQQMAETGMAPATVDLWLRAVLVAWREMVRDEVTARIRAELKGRKFP